MNGHLDSPRLFSWETYSLYQVKGLYFSLAISVCELIICLKTLLC